MRIELRPQAEEEFEAAASWYENEKLGLGSAFTDAVISAFTAIARQPSAYPPVGRGARRFIIRRFPYVIIYRVEGDAIVVYACIHSHRDPRRWHERL
jgi:plasmid stabilization system protein ParE